MNKIHETHKTQSPEELRIAKYEMEKDCEDIGNDSYIKSLYETKGIHIVTYECKGKQVEVRHPKQQAEILHKKLLKVGVNAKITKEVI